ncbi:HDOD domain-containing protein, partial [Candidatus Poribacteria bacterium]|nr:HDOD domain-containing protein [Candidatus Poribacteria bacterium]
MLKKKIGELLVENGYIARDQLERGLQVQKKRKDRICNILIDLGYLTEEGFLEFLATMPGMASLELARCEIDRSILDIIPSELARKLEIVPIGRIGKLLTVAMVCPLDDAARGELESVTGLKVKPILCSKKAVFRAIDRYYGKAADKVSESEAKEGPSALEYSLKLQRVARLVEEIEELPTLPDIVNAISSVVSDPNSSSSDLAKVIASDGALSAKILKLANSAAFGFARKISDIQHAVTLLGFKETQALAMSVSIVDQFIDKTKFDFRIYWNHSFACATLARLVSRNLGTRGTDIAFVAGLLHDVGNVVLAMSMSGKQEKVSSMHSSIGMSQIDAEEKVLGITHAEVGYLLGEHWLLPAELTKAIRYHHMPELEPAPKGPASIIFLANKFCKADAAKTAE